MSKKLFISFLFLSALTLSISSAMAFSTVYTDEIGRHHFLGKDPGSQYAQKSNQYVDYTNSKTKDVTDAIYKNTENATNSSNTLFNNMNNETKVNIKTPSTEDAYSFETKTPSRFRGFRDTTSDTYGVNESKTIYTDEIGRMHFFTKDSKIKY